MIPPASLFRIIRSCSDIPIIIRWTTLEDAFFNIIFSMRSFTLSLQLESIDKILRQTELILNAGDQSSVRIDRQICPLE